MKKTLTGHELQSLGRTSSSVITRHIIL